MEIICYAVGKNIAIQELDSISSTEIIQSILVNNNPLFFSTYEGAKRHAQSQALLASNSIPGFAEYVAFPIIFSFKMEYQTGDFFKCVEAFTAHCYNHPKGIPYIKVISGAAFAELLTLKCNRINYNGDDAIWSKARTPLAMMTFLMGNRMGLQPKNQEKTFQFPRELCMEIFKHTTDTCLYGESGNCQLIGSKP